MLLPFHADLFIYPIKKKKKRYIEGGGRGGEGVRAAGGEACMGVVKVRAARRGGPAARHELVSLCPGWWVPIFVDIMTP